MGTRPSDAERAAEARIEGLRYAAMLLDRAATVRAANGKAAELLGREPGTLIGRPLTARRGPGDVPEQIRLPRFRNAVTQTVWLDGADDEQFLVRVEIRRDRSGLFLALLEEATSIAKAASFVAFEREILGLIAAGVDAPSVFDSAGRALQAALGIPVAFFTADRALTRLSLISTDAVAPSVRDVFRDGIAVGRTGAACGQAVARGRPVIVRDLEAGTIPRVMQEVLVRAGIRACWSYPIIARSGTVLGSLAAYPPAPSEPGADAVDLLQKAAELSALVLERVRNDEDRFAQEHRYRTLATMSSDFAYCFELEDDGPPRLAWVTDAFERITSYAPEEWVERGAWRGIIHPDDLRAFEQRLPRLMEGEEVAGEYRILTKDGGVRWLNLRTRPVRDPANGRVTSIIGSAHDFTARKEAEDAKTMFLATASHELKTPLTVIQGFAQMLGTEQATQVEDEAIGAIRRRAIQLNKIIDRILLSSRIETGRTSIALMAVDPLPILIEQTESLARATGREITLAVDGDIDPVEADPDALITVVDHLLDNAVKYSPDGGPIRVHVQAAADHQVIEIADRGIGMEPEQVARCFEKFWQAESTDVRRFGGTGIGLFIVRSLVEAMGGRVEVTSARGSGSTFRVTLRRAKTPADAPSGGEPSVIREFMRQLGIPARREL